MVRSGDLLSSDNRGAVNATEEGKEKSKTWTKIFAVLGGRREAPAAFSMEMSSVFRENDAVYFILYFREREMLSLFLMIATFTTIFPCYTPS